jgi:hypothetical protein
MGFDVKVHGGEKVADRSAIIALGSRSEPRRSGEATPIPKVDKALGSAFAGGVPPAWAGAGSLPAAVGSRLAGLGAAVLLALAVRPAATETVTNAGGRRFAAAGFLLVGGFLGVLPVCVLGAATALGHLLATALARVMHMQCSPPWTPILWVLALSGLLVCGPSVECPPELGVLGQAIVVLVLVSVTGVLSLGSLTIGDRRGTD